MFNPEYAHPLQPFSWQHFVALAVILTIILIVFFTRKFFIKYPLADKIFRFSLAFIIIFFEVFPVLRTGAKPIFAKFIRPYPLCGFLLWITAVALLSNSARIEKVIFPVALTGSLMSLIVLDMNFTFPHFNAFQFFFTHGGFLLGALYFFFTKKISRYTIKDLGKSLLFLLGMSCYNLIFTYQNPSFDRFFIISPPGELIAIKNALGQFGYTLIYLLLIVGVQFAIYGITYACTHKRKYDDILEPKFKDNKALNALTTKLTQTQRLAIVFSIASAGIYIATLQKATNSKVLVWFDLLFVILSMAAFVINEVVVNYKKYHIAKNEIAPQNKLKSEINENENDGTTELNNENAISKDETIKTSESKEDQEKDAISKTISDNDNK